MNHVVYVSRDNIDIPLSFEGLALEFYQTSVYLKGLSQLLPFLFRYGNASDLIAQNEH